MALHRNSLLLISVALLSMLAGMGIFRFFVEAEQPAASTAPSNIALAAIPLTGLDGSSQTIADLDSDILVVNFWAPWCAPCRREIPSLIEFQKLQDNNRVQVIGIALDGKEPVQRFIEEYQINYPNFLAGNRIPMYNAAFGNPSGSLPFTVILNQQREITFQHNGVVSLQQLLEQIEKF
jgi:thiol-disulfide isomerase/thioredoxin